VFAAGDAGAPAAGGGVAAGAPAAGAALDPGAAAAPFFTTVPAFGAAAGAAAPPAPCAIAGIAKSREAATPAASVLISRMKDPL
jgi:hypothetical protein